MESWMGLGSKNGDETARGQKTTESDAKALDFHSKKESLGSHKKSKSKQKQNIQPVSILKSPKYSTKSEVVTVD